jgi:hypothetical protein
VERESSRQPLPSWRAALIVGVLLLGCARKSSTGTANPQSTPSLSPGTPTTEAGAEARPRAPSNRAERKRELTRVIDDNVGHAHFTRGMNMQTFEALRKATTPADIPVLEELLADDDRVVALTAANVLGDMGEDGILALQRAARTLRGASPDRAGLVEEVLWEAQRSTSPIEDPFEQPPRGTSPNCGPDERKSKAVQLRSKDDFVRFVRERGASVSRYLHPDNFRGPSGEIDWARVATATTTSALASGMVYTLEFVPRGCGTFTFRMNANGYTSLYGCCGK